MRSSTLFRSLLACVCSAGMLPSAWGQEDKTALIFVQGAFVQGAGELKQNPKNGAATLKTDGQVTFFDTATSDLTQNLYVQWAFNEDSLAKWTGAYGINVSPVEPALQEQLQIKEKDGLIIISLNDDALAAKVDLKLHDIILGLQKTPDATKPANVTIIRQGKASQRSLPAVTPAKPYWIGVQTATIEEPLRVQLSLTDGKGLLLTEVIKNTPALQAGLQANDVLVGAEQADFSKTEDLAKVVQKSEGKPITFRLIRHAKPMTITITPALRPKEGAQANAVSNVYLLHTSNEYLNRVHTANAITNQLGLQYTLPLVRPTVTFDPATTPTQIEKLQEELARMTASATAMQQQLQALSEQLKQQKTEGKK